MAGKEQKWLLTHDSHELKKGEVYKGETLPLWLAGKAIPVYLQASCGCIRNPDSVGTAKRTGL